MKEEINYKDIDPQKVFDVLMSPEFEMLVKDATNNGYYAMK